MHCVINNYDYKFLIFVVKRRNNMKNFLRQLPQEIFHLIK